MWSSTRRVRRGAVSETCRLPAEVSGLLELEPRSRGFYGRISGVDALPLTILSSTPPPTG